MSGPKQLYRWIEEGEHEQQDFKETISSSRKIAKTIGAFANTRGGRILVGVRDNRAIRGIKADEEKHMLEAAASYFCKPAVTLHFELIDIGLKQVLLAEVPEATNKPVYVLGEDEKWWAYIRVADKSLLASKTVIDVIRHEQKGENTLIQLSSKEEGLLKYLAEQQRITLKQYCKLMNISPWRARKILVNLISAGIIRVHTTEKAEFYTLA
ncbi:MAG: helix-turn-helix domain-containing protein [Bacteroidia bacterium]